MVSKSEEAVQAPLPDSSPAPEPEPDNPILAEIESLNNAPSVDISSPVEEEAVEEPAAEEPEASVAPEPVTQAPPEEEAPAKEAEPTPEEPKEPATPQLTTEQVQQLQRQADEYAALQQKAVIQKETEQYQRQLESQGYEEEQAQQAARTYMDSRQAQQNLIQKADEYSQHLMGKVAAAEHFAQKYSLQMNDLGALRQAETPEVMEEIAKRMAEDRKLRSELKQLRQAQVPTQQFDNSQGEPQVAASDDSWLDRYNAGDRSTNAMAAARKNLGLS